MKEFDIFLNKRLTECDIIVYSLPLRNSEIAINRTIIESCIESYNLYKTLALQSESRLVAHIDKMLKACYERLELCADIEASADICSKFAIYPKPSYLEVSNGQANRVKLLAVVSSGSRSTMQLGVEPILANINRSAGRCDFGFAVKQDTFAILKHCVEKPATRLVPFADVTGTFKRSFLSENARIPILSAVDDLLYRVYFESTCLSEVQITSDLFDIEIHHSLGKPKVFIDLGANIDRGGIQSTKYLQLENSSILSANVNESLIHPMEPCEHSVEITVQAELSVKRYRLLSDMDNDDFSTYDNMQLGEVDFILE